MFDFFTHRVIIQNAIDTAVPSHFSAFVCLHVLFELSPVCV